MKFEEVFCSQCGQGFGPSDHGYSSCSEHIGLLREQRGLKMTNLQSGILAVEILQTIARRCSEGKATAISADLGFGTGTIEIDGKHSRFGQDSYELDDKKQTESFIKGLHDLLVKRTGLSFR